METEDNICQEILDSVKECLEHRWDHAQPEERPRQNPTSTSKPDPWAKFQERMHTTYDHLKDVRERSCEEALAIAQDAH